MTGNWLRVFLLLLAAAGVGACASNAVQPGIIYSAGAPSGGAYGGGPYGSGPYGGGPYGSGPYGSGPYGSGPYGSGPYGSGPYNSGGPYGATRISGPGQVQQASAAPMPAQGSNSGPGVGDSGRVVSIRDVSVAGPGYSAGGGNGPFIGGLLGAGAGATIGAITAHTLGGGIVGAVLGMVGGAIAGTIADGQRGAGRGIEVTVQRDDGQQVTVAQRDDGDIQLGDRVQIVQNRQGVAQVVRDTARAPD